MPRKRMIDPNIWESEDFATLSVLGKLLFIGLFSLADDEGRGKANPIYLRSKLFPYEADKVRTTDVENALSEIARSMSVVFYAHNDSKYYALTNWDKWQKIEKPSPSNIPAPTDSDTIRGTFADESGNSRGVITAEGSPNKNKNKNKNMNTNINTRGVQGGEYFTDFWDAYPKKTAKQDAERAWNKLHPSKDLADKIIEDVNVRKNSADWLKDGGQFIPYPATYLNKRRWEDEFTTARHGYNEHPIGNLDHLLVNLDD